LKLGKENLEFFLWMKEVLGVSEVFLGERYEVRDKRSLLEAIRRQVFQCRKCPLYRTKTNYVFGDGNPDAGLMLVGEAPGRDEDLQGIPFVGRAGKLLTELLEEAGLDREKDVYIANVLKCRPPGNRDPKPDEIAACSPYLDAQIRIIKPRVLGALGRYSGHFLSGQNLPLSSLRGRVLQSIYGIKLVVTYHPAAILRNPNLIDRSRKDFELMLKLLRE